MGQGIIHIIEAYKKWDGDYSKFNEWFEEHKPKLKDNILHDPDLNLRFVYDYEKEEAAIIVEGKSIINVNPKITYETIEMDEYLVIKNPKTEVEWGDLSIQVYKEEDFNKIFRSETLEDKIEELEEEIKELQGTEEDNEEIRALNKVQLYSMKAYLNILKRKERIQNDNNNL